MEDTVKRTGYIGVGRMGAAIATNVVQGGFDLIVFDVRQEPLEQMAGLGATIAASPREVAEYAEIIETSVVDDAQLEAVLLGPDGVLEGARPGTIFAIHSTVHPATVQRLAPIARAEGVEIIDAQVSGGRDGARDHTLCYMVGGDEELMERCRPVFETSGNLIFHMGGLGAGCMAKIAQQIITAINLLAASEGWGVAERAGLNLETFDQLIRVTSGQSHMADRWFSNFMKAATIRETEVWYQGLLPALELGHDLGLALPGTALTQQLFPKILKSHLDGTTAPS